MVKAEVTVYRQCLKLSVRMCVIRASIHVIQVIRQKVSKIPSGVGPIKEGRKLETKETE